MYIIDFLRSRGVWYEAILYRPASSSSRRAGNAHIPGQKVAKAVLVSAGDSLILAVLPSTCWIDLGRLSEIIRTPVSQMRLATPVELLATFHDCEPGVVPPFGSLYGLKTFLDWERSLSPELVFGANTRHEGLRMHCHDFLALEQPVLASFSRPAPAASPLPRHRGRDRLAS
jgi:Ala-tRNA(Pro) deacylase